MMAGNPSWWSMHSFSPSLLPSPYLPIGSSSSSSSYSSSLPLNPLDGTNHQELPQPWTQLLLGDDQDQRLGQRHFQPKKLENLEDRQMFLNSSIKTRFLVDIKHDLSQNSSSSFRHGDENQFQTASRASSTTTSWSISSSSPRSCVTSLSNGLIDLSYNKTDGNSITFQNSTDHSSEFNSTSTGGVCKKARVQRSSSQPPLKVRKEKLGDKISALHQLVSPFGKTDTASVLLEALGYIRFLQGQIEALTSPYMGANMRNQQSDKREKRPKDLRGKGLFLVPVSFTHMVGSDGGSDYWPPDLNDGF